MTTARAEFERLYVRLDAIHEQLFVDRGALHDQYRAAIFAAAEPLYASKRKRKKNQDLDFSKAFEILGEKAFEIQDAFKSKADAAYDVYAAEKKVIEARLDELAPDAEIRHSDFWIGFSERGSWDYRSQGWGAATYAEGACQMDALVPKSFDVETMVVQEERSYGTGYVVAVKLESLVDVDIIRRRPSLSLREWMKAAWKNGVNPRVLNPWLPHGLEEKLGIDYFGNDKEKS